MQQSEGRATGRQDGELGWIVFENAPRMNALSPDMAGQAHALLDGYAADPAIRVILLRGIGEKAFISGGDISRFEKTRFDPETARRDTDRPDAFCAALRAVRKPVIAMIHGYCLGGGMNVAMSADLRFGSETSQLGIPAALRGTAYPDSGLRMLIDLVGPGVAKDLMFSGRRLDAGAALRVGLLNGVFTPEELEPELIRYARTLAANAPLSIRASKFCIDQLMLPEERRDVRTMQAMQDTAKNSDDFKEATRAFMEKRKPVFRGR
ncbi:enoyl-CoA hydratase-related protein [Salipiger sp.]|uniref:enoyl-CoA hydratase-related protein n=1 Tax=Salipiger sp. TaxID=2078585 RepID=UPI003A97189D